MDDIAVDINAAASFRQARYAKLDEPAAAKHWVDKPGVKNSKKRFVAIFNDRAANADPVCGELRSASAELIRWIEPLRRSVSRAKPRVQDCGSCSKHMRVMTLSMLDSLRSSSDYLMCVLTL